MKQISTLIAQYKPEQRKDILKKFITVLNRDREFNKRKPFKDSFWAFKMSHVKTDQLTPFFNECKRAENFSKYWWGRLKVNHNTKLN